MIAPEGLVLYGVCSVQVGAAFATHLFHVLGPAGTAFLRTAFAAPALLMLWRPHVKGYTRRDYLLVVLFGLAVAAMNFSLYSALNRIPLGIAVTLEFIGPLGVAVAGSHRTLDLLWVLLAATGIVLLAPWGGLRLDALGGIWALLAGCFWAAYILLAARVGQAFPGGAGLAMALTIGTVALLPVGVITGGGHLLDPRVLALGALVALLSSVIPYSVELEALRALPTQVFGVLMSTEPAVAAIIGFLVLHQVLRMRSVVAIVLVTIAATGASRFRATVPLFLQSEEEGGEL